MKSREKGGLCVPKPTVAVAMSGGVDSSVTCMLLAEQGFELFGITMKILGTQAASQMHSACAPAVEEEAREVCRKLGVPHYTVDLTEEFEAEIITPFIENYLKGRTPNPCVLCNPKFKFGHLLNKARELGADYLATGHYAQAGKILEQTGEFTENHVIAEFHQDVCRSPDGSIGQQTGKPRSRYLLARGKDPGKDQSYVLYGLNQDMLGHAMLPLGGLTKEQVVDISRRRGLVAADKPESQEICFVGGGSYRAFLRERNVEARPGLIVDTSGKVVGRHQGLAYYTVGQRRGLGISGPHSLYVVNIDPDANQVVVGTREEAYAKGCYVGDVNFIMSDHPGSPVRGTCMVRYRGREVNATLIPDPDDRYGAGKRQVSGVSSALSSEAGSEAEAGRGDAVVETGRDGRVVETGNGSDVVEAGRGGRVAENGSSNGVVEAGRGNGLVEAGNRDGLVLVEFDEPQFAVTPGQALVFYQGAFVYGGGTILKSLR